MIRIQKNIILIIQEQSLPAVVVKQSYDLIGLMMSEYIFQMIRSPRFPPSHSSLLLLILLAIWPSPFLLSVNSSQLDFPPIPLEDHSSRHHPLMGGPCLDRGGNARGRKEVIKSILSIFAKDNSATNSSDFAMISNTKR